LQARLLDTDVFPSGWEASHPLPGVGGSIEEGCFGEALVAANTGITSTVAIVKFEKGGGPYPQVVQRLGQSSPAQAAASFNQATTILRGCPVTSEPDYHETVTPMSAPALPGAPSAAFTMQALSAGVVINSDVVLFHLGAVLCSIYYVDVGGPTESAMLHLLAEKAYAKLS